MPSLEQIDIVRERAGVSYKEAKEALEMHNDDVVDAIIYLEQQKRSGQSWIEYAQVRGSELVDAIKRLVQEGNVRRIRVLQNDRVLIEFPVTAGALGALIVPQLAALGVVAALLAKCTIEIEKVNGDGSDQPPTPPADQQAQ